MVFVARLTVDGPFHKGLLRNIQLSQTVDYDMHMNIAAAVVTVHVGADQRLMPRKVGFYIFHADGLRLFTCQSTLVFVGRIKADEVVVSLDFVVILILVVLIGLVVIFKNQLTKLVNNIFKKITNQSNGI